MAFTSPFTAVTGATILASQWNTSGRDNLNAIWVYTAAGDIAYATSATQLARLAKPSGASLLQNNNTGTLAWIAKANVGGYHAKATKDQDLSNQAIPGTSTWTDLTGATVNITTSVQCTLKVEGYVTAACNTAGNTEIIRAVIAATADSGQLPETSAAQYVPLPYSWYKAAVALGTYTVKFQAWANGAGGKAGLARLNVLAIPE